MYPSPPDHSLISDFAYKHRYIILVMVLIDSIMANLDSSMVNIVLPTITTTFHATLADSQWVITAYLLTMTSLFIICGKISEFVGICRLFIFGSLVFTLSSLACGFAVDLNHLIFFCVLQGFGSSMVAGISTVIIFRVFPPGEIGRALGYSGSIFSVCAMCGPALGGLINDLGGDILSTTAGCLGASLGVTLASLLITLELNTAGFYGPILSADIGLLSRSVGWVIVFTGEICAIGAFASIIRNRDLVSENRYEHGA